MPRSNELAFLKEKLAHAEAAGNETDTVNLKQRIRRLKEDVSQFNRGLLRKPWR